MPVFLLVPFFFVSLFFGRRSERTAPCRAYIGRRGRKEGRREGCRVKLYDITRVICFASRANDVAV